MQEQISGKLSPEASWRVFKWPEYAEGPKMSLCFANDTAEQCKYGNICIQYQHTHIHGWLHVNDFINFTYFIIAIVSSYLWSRR